MGEVLSQVAMDERLENEAVESREIFHGLGASDAAQGEDSMGNYDRTPVFEASGTVSKLLQTRNPAFFKAMQKMRVEATTGELAKQEGNSSPASKPRQSGC